MLLEPLAVLAAAAVVGLFLLLWVLVHSALVYWVSRPGVLKRLLQDE